MRRVIAGLATGVLLVGFILAPVGRPRAAEPSSEADPSELVQQINAAYEQGEYLRAAELLERAYQADPQPSLLYSRGEALLAAEDYEGARRAFLRFLATEPPEVDAAAARERVARCEEQLAPPPPVYEAPVPTSPPPDAPQRRRSRVDGVLVGLLCAGTAVSVTGAGLLVGARWAIDRTEDPGTEGEWERSIARSRGLATAGTVALGIGGTLLAGAAIRAILIRRNPRSRALLRR